MDTYRNKIKTVEAAIDECHRMREQGKRVVFTNGCFDILHPGHTRYLSSARELGDFLVVALNSDKSVRTIKGPKRPILGEEARAELIAALRCVDLVLIFDEDNPLRVITELLPHILVKGGDWAEDEIIGADVVKRNGGEVRRIPFITGFSTTAVIEKIVGLYA
ncbi:MAG: D-glycero-beta-D-manno-heptose 1-phosphate adenylyltransferase [Deltaproteobacteria bacterium]|nr:D-glycero-beta-D-manno-heptose 1-phosphate adenylyltransferase [Deltaproteobacteria bacterium]MBW2050056.1 D-glycero-beta-D-manno-heptose 1-phosphate adenylyltransferase [Deltaproteobacteria bacterium]MBW2112467.1 D-glycero-beta-D-manno-heptose 1-phosphate adenylyltransferase [Deltaproteobacteria bacterium]MBW2354846.1 D-glycero-beta-D-manno-heptose 1-phosphate adenylyltransferase [Deltaproteobacteria bacterium]